MKKLLFLFSGALYVFACCCQPSSCDPVKHSLENSIKKAERGVETNDKELFAKNLKEIQNLQTQILQIQTQITDLQNKITALRKVQDYYANQISKESVKRDNLLYLLNRQITLINKSLNLYDKMLYYSQKGQK